MEQELLYVLGTGNAAVTRCYNTCFAIRDKNEYFMVDTGGGNGILGILEDMKIGLDEIHHLFLTHKHNDHLLGIVWMVRMIATRMQKGEYEGDLNIYCHDELPETIRTICQLTLQKKFYSLIGERIHIIEVKDRKTRRILDYDVQFFDILSTKARQFGFTMTLQNGKKLVCAGDEPLNPACEPLAQNADWMFHEAFCLYEERDKWKPYEKHHSTVKDACELASRLNVKNLVLWHTEDRCLAQRKARYTAEGAPLYHGNLFVPDDKEILTL